MVYHEWGEDFDWKGLNEAIDIVYNFCWKWGRLGGYAKEKYGTFRFQGMHFGLSLHSLIYPRYFCYKHKNFPSWLWSLDIRYIEPILRKLFGWIWFPYQHWVYRKAYSLAVKKYPHLTAEILTDANYREFLQGLGHDWKEWVSYDETIN